MKFKYKTDDNKIIKLTESDGTGATVVTVDVGRLLRENNCENLLPLDLEASSLASRSTGSSSSYLDTVEPVARASTLRKGDKNRSTVLWINFVLIYLFHC